MWFESLPELTLPLGRSPFEAILITAPAPSPAGSLNRLDCGSHDDPCSTSPSFAQVYRQQGQPPDFLNNILLYIPLGIALSGSSLLRTFLFGLFLSTAAEVLQLGYVDRSPSFADITSNTCGALVGYLVALLWLRATGFDPKSLRIPRAVAAAGIPAAILGVILSS